MSDIAALCKKINENYIHCQSDPAVQDMLFRDLSKYLDFVLLPIVKSPYDRADVVQTALINIFDKGLKQYRANKSGFTTYCSTIAKNTANDFFRTKKRKNLTLTGDEILEEASSSLGDAAPVPIKNPERTILELEQQLAQIEALKRVLDIFLIMDKPPYRLVSSGFSIFLGRKYHPTSKDLTFVKWAYEELEQATVSDGSFRFLTEMNEWIPSHHIEWGPEFKRQILYEDKKIRKPIHSIVFGKHFKQKDFENWCTSVRTGIKNKLMELEYNRSSISF